MQLLICNFLQKFHVFRAKHLITSAGAIILKEFPDFDRYNLYKSRFCMKIIANVKQKKLLTYKATDSTLPNLPIRQCWWSWDLFSARLQKWHFWAGVIMFQICINCSAAKAKDHIPEMVFKVIDRLKDNTCMYLYVDKMILEMIRKRSVDW